MSTQAYDDFWVRHGLPAARRDEFRAWLLAARVSSMTGGAPAHAAVSVFLQGAQPDELRGVIGDDGVQYSAVPTDDTRRAIADGDRRFPGLRALLWRGNVIHGEQVLDLAPKGRAVFPRRRGRWRSGLGSSSRHPPSSTR